MKKNKLKFTHKKIPLKTKIRYLFLGKYPLERKYLPKVLEYLFLVFANTVMLSITVLTLFYLLKFDVNTNKYILDTKKLIDYQWRLAIAIFIISYIVVIFMSLHILVILPKTEFNKWIGITSIIFSLLFLSPLGMLFAMVAYVKNEIVFE